MFTSQKERKLVPIVIGIAVTPGRIAFIKFAVRMGIEPISTDRQSVMLAVTPTNLEAALLQPQGMP